MTDLTQVFDYVSMNGGSLILNMGSDNRVTRSELEIDTTDFSAYLEVDQGNYGECIGCNLSRSDLKRLKDALNALTDL